MRIKAWYIDSTDRPAVAFSALLAGLGYVRHGVTMRGEPDAEHNYSFATGQDKEQVRSNRARIASRLGFTAADLVMAQQVHAAEVTVVRAGDRGRASENHESAIAGCDALTTDVPGILLGIVVADCLPVFVVDPEHRAIGIAHSGWRGTAGRIVPALLERMRESFGTSPGACYAAIGPGIGADGYEVDLQVYQGFPEEERNAPGVFRPTREAHYALDLTTAVRFQLHACGVPSMQVSASRWRTHSDPALFYSHRLVNHCPRMGAFLGLLPDGVQ